MGHEYYFVLLILNIPQTIYSFLSVISCHQPEERTKFVSRRDARDTKIVEPIAADEDQGKKDNVIGDKH